MKETTRSNTGVANRNAIDADMRRACNNNDKSHTHANTRAHVSLIWLIGSRFAHCAKYCNAC